MGYSQFSVPARETGKKSRLCRPLTTWPLATVMGCERKSRIGVVARFWEAGSDVLPGNNEYPSLRSDRRLGSRLKSLPRGKVGSYGETARMALHIRLPLRSDDPPETRAAKIMAVCGMTEGDPKQLSEILHWMTHCLERYAAADEEARKGR